MCWLEWQFLDINTYFSSYVMKAFHTSTITGMDMCTRKPLIATSSLDKTVKIWNYITKTLELVGVYPEDALSIAMHPNGIKQL